MDEKKKKELDYKKGCTLPFEDWAWLNLTGVFENNELAQFVSPFPPKNLIHNVSGLSNKSDFAKHGIDIYEALLKASPIPLAQYEYLLDFGCGSGRLARTTTRTLRKSLAR